MRAIFPSLLAFVWLAARIEGLPRASQTLDKITDHIVPEARVGNDFVEDKTNATVLTHSSRTTNVSQGFPKWIDEWVAPVEMREWFPYYLTGCDEDGSPVAVIEYGRWRFSEAVLRKDLGGRDTVRKLFTTYLDQGITRLEREGQANGGQGIGIIFDWDGFSLANYADPVALELGLRQFAQLDRLYNVLNYAYLINTNFAAENFIRLAKPFIGNILEKCEIFGTQRHKWLPHILRKIPKNQLPDWYGGSRDWRPIWIGGARIKN